METFMLLDSDTAIVHVTIDDATKHYYQSIKFTITSEGLYLISNIENDA
jgi:hypothetical protein